MWWGWRVFHTHYTEKVFPQNGFSGTEYSVLCRWGLVMFWAFGFPSHVNYVVLSYWWTFTAECFPTFLQSQKFSLVPIACIWIEHPLIRVAASASKDPGERELSVFQEKNTALTDGCLTFTEHSFFPAWALLCAKVWDDHQFVATYLALWGFFPELTEHPISEPFSGRDAGLSTQNWQCW